ncbi:MAG: prolyl oligopeptidase family serine peptidase [Acidobacteriota bacterium]
MPTKLVLAMASVLAVTAPASAPASGLLEAREGHETQLVRQERHGDALAPPPPELFTLVKYPTELGEMTAYLGTAPGPGRHPAILWITGGFPAGGVGSSAWERSDPDNDQSAKAYRLSELVMMYPALRGSFGNPGVQETLYGEVDDVLAALSYLQRVPHVDPDRIYLGGHSTGGTLALLVAAATSDLAGVIAFGPVADPAGYGTDSLTHDPDDERENRLRSPVHYLDAITPPTLVLEGETGNSSSLRELASATDNEQLRTCLVRGADHFDVLAPVNRLLARTLVAEEAFPPSCDDVQSAFTESKSARREADDLDTLADLRRSGIGLSGESVVQHYLIDRERDALVTAAANLRGWKTKEIRELQDSEGRPFHVLIVTRTLRLTDLDSVFAATQTVQALARRHDLHHDGWDVQE